VEKVVEELSRLGLLLPRIADLLVLRFAEMPGER
jgi:hypothetical protein